MLDHTKMASDLAAADWMSDTALVQLAEAQVHATLALVEQQRIANLSALFQVSDEDANDFMTMGLSYPEVFAEIREGLGL